MSDSQVLGQRRRETNIDYGLAERLNAEAAEEERKKRLLQEERRKELKARKEVSLKPNPGKEPQAKPPFSPSRMTLEDISCIDYDGNVFERYDKLELVEDVAIASHNQIEVLNYFNGNNEGFFIPSFALTCNILAKLLKKTDSNDTNEKAHAKMFLNQYSSILSHKGWHWQNTVIDWENQVIAHYLESMPCYTKYHPSQARLDFQLNQPGGAYFLDMAMQSREMKVFVNNLTGLASSGAIIRVGKYLGRETKIHLPTEAEKSQPTLLTLLGSDKNHFNLHPYRKPGVYAAAIAARIIDRGDSK